MTTLNEASLALTEASERYREARTEQQLANSRECAALNALNKAQKEFDEAVAALRKEHGIGTTDWGRTSGGVPK